MRGGQYLEEAFKGSPERQDLMRALWMEESLMNVRHCPNRHMSERRDPPKVRVE